MADRNRGGPVIGLVRAPGEAGGLPLAALRDELTAQGWTAKILGPGAGVRGVRLVHIPSAAVASRWLNEAQRAGARSVVSVRVEEAHMAAFDRVEGLPHTWPSSDRLHVESETIAGLVRDHAAPAGTIAVIPPFADPCLLHKPLVEPAVPTPLRLLGTGPLSWIQGYEFALDAVSLLRRRGIPCEYRIAGDGPHADAVAFAQHQLGLNGCVELVGEPSPDALRRHLGWASALVDVAVLPGSPRTVLDAQAAGVPVVTANPPEDASDTVLAVPARDPDALSEALAALARDGDLRERIVRAGRERALAAPTPAAHAARCRQLYGEVLDGA
jgi:glycosyltransferase involved in cell wall biosynthesis